MGTLYTFYSYKGGVGRSMALANVAALLSKWKKRVLVIDWDLEAPGLEKYFKQKPSALRGSRKQKKGVVDLVTDFARGAPLDWETCLLKAFPFGPDSPAVVDILSAGQDTPEYVPSLQAIDWRRLFNEQNFGAYLEDLRDEWLNKYDFVLVDSRTGITDIGSVCTIHLPDVLVLLFTANEQSLNGVLDVMQRARAKYSNLPEEYERPRTLIGVPVPSRLEYFTENEKARAWLKSLPQILADIFEDWLPAGTTPDAILERLFIPNIAVWSFGENLPVVQEGTTNPKSIGFSYELLALLLKYNLQWGKALHGDVEPTDERPPALINSEAGHAFSQLDQAEQQTARRVFMNLVQVVPAGEGEDTRRRAPFSEFDEPSQRVIEKLADVGLLNFARDEVANEKTIEIAQDSILRSWDRLKEWIRKDRDFLVWRKQFRANVTVWEQSGRNKADLLSGAKLETAKLFLSTNADDLNAAEREHITASEDEAARKRRAERSNKIGVAVGILFFVVIMFFSFRSSRERQRLESEEKQKLAYTQAVASTAKGVDLADKNDFSGAVTLYNEAIQQKPDYDAAYFNRGIALANLGQKEEAATDFNKVLQISGDPQTRQTAQDYLQQLRNPLVVPTPEIDTTPTPQVTPTPRVKPSPGATPTPAPSPGPTIKPISVQPRIYIQIQDKADLPPAKQVAAILSRQGFMVPPIEVRSGPPSTQVRFYRKDDTKEASLIVETLRGLGVTDAQTRYLIGYENSTAIRPKRYELWFGAGSLKNVKPAVAAY